MADISKYTGPFERLKSDRQTIQTYWQDISRIMLPSRDFYHTYSQGAKRNTRIFDTTGMYACEQLAGGLHSMLTNPSSKWFSLRPSDPDIELTNDALLWIDAVTQRMYQIFNAEKSQFNSQVHEMYLELCAFGTGVMYSDYRAGRIRFRSFPLADCYIAENDEGVIDTMYRETCMTYTQAKQYFGEKASENINKKLDKTPYEDVRILHVVTPRENGVKGGYAKEKPFKSCYLDLDGRTIMSEGGYDVFPYQVPRFSKRSGEVYGFGPGGQAYPDVKMLQRMSEVSIRGAEKMVDPPLLVPDDSVIGPITLNAGGIINYRGESDPITALESKGRPDFGMDYIQMVQQRILQHFYVDWMTLPTRTKGDQMTATEVLERRNQRLQMLSPMLSRLNVEFTDSLIDRVFDLGLRNGLFPDLPEELRGVNLKVEYISPIAQAQRSVDMEAITRSIGMAAQLVEIKPDIMDNFDLDGAVRYGAERVNFMPQQLIVPLEIMGQQREQRAQAQAQANQAMMAETQSKAIKNAANADKFAAQTQEIAG